MSDTDNTNSDRWTIDRITSKIRTASSHVPRLFVELAVVFIGVYLAFLLTDYQEELEKGEIRIKFYESFIVELSTVVEHLDVEEGENLLWHLSTVEEIRKGNRPNIPARPLYYSISGLVLTAAFDSRNFESLNTDTVNDLVQLSLYMESLKQRINTFNSLLVSLLSEQKSDVDCCYDTQHKLLDDYSWYPKLVLDIYDLNIYIRDRILNSAIPDLQELKES